MAATSGNCFICGKTAGKTAIKNHVLKEHKSGNEPCYLIRAEGAYNKDYWLLFSVALGASMSAVDNFLRDIWCECCGHMSAFSMGGREVGKARKVSALNVGDALLYEYDFGSTTEILVTIVDEISRAKQREQVQLLARNVPTEDSCDNCGAPATLIDAWESGFYCDDCADEADDEDGLMPIVNSPRCGECGYDGELDIWTFDPKKPFPQPQKQKRRIQRPEPEPEIPAEDKWNRIEPEFQQKLINSTFCVKCKLTSITDFTIDNLQQDIILRGKCAKCGGNVARTIECD